MVYMAIYSPKRSSKTGSLYKKRDRERALIKALIKIQNFNIIHRKSAFSGVLWHYPPAFRGAAPVLRSKYTTLKFYRRSNLSQKNDPV